MVDILFTPPSDLVLISMQETRYVGDIVLILIMHFAALNRSEYSRDSS